MNFNLYNFTVDWAQRALRRFGGRVGGRGGGRVGGAQNVERIEMFGRNQAGNVEDNNQRRLPRLPHGDLHDMENVYDDVDPDADAIRYNIEGDFVRAVNFEG